MTPVLNHVHTLSGLQIKGYVKRAPPRSVALSGWKKNGFPFNIKTIWTVWATFKRAQIDTNSGSQKKKMCRSWKIFQWILELSLGHDAWIRLARYFVCLNLQPERPSASDSLWLMRGEFAWCQENDCFCRLPQWTRLSPGCEDENSEGNKTMSLLVG